jgi:hypothetical protein
MFTYRKSDEIANERELYYYRIFARGEDLLGQAGRESCGWLHAAVLEVLA